MADKDDKKKPKKPPQDRDDEEFNRTLDRLAAALHDDIEHAERLEKIAARINNHDDDDDDANEVLLFTRDPLLATCYSFLYVLDEDFRGL